MCCSSHQESTVEYNIYSLVLLYNIGWWTTIHILQVGSVVCWTLKVYNNRKIASPEKSKSPFSLRFSYIRCAEYLWHVLSPDDVQETTSNGLENNKLYLTKIHFTNFLPFSLLR